MRSDLKFIVDFTLGGVLSLIFVFCGKYDNDGLYVVGLIMYAHLFWSIQMKYERLERRLKKYQKAANELIRLTEHDKTDCED